MTRTRESFIRLVGIACALLAAAAPSRADFGNCGQPASFGPKPLASDALSVLRAAVGTLDCTTCVCDATGDGKVTSSDALRVLRFAVGLDAGLDCPVCRSEKVIGAAGGTIQSLDKAVTITIPAGALDSDTTVSIEGGALSDLPASLRTNATAWRLAPSGLTFNVPATVTIPRDDASVSGLGAKIAMLVSVDEDGVEVLDNQTQTVDSTSGPTRVAALAELGHFSTLAIVPLGVTARVVGVPTSVITVDEGLVLTALVSENAGEDIVGVVSASYIDDNFGAFQPDGIETADVPLEEVTEGNFGHGLDYICSSQVSAFFTPRIRTVYDVTAAFDGAPSGVEHTTLMKTNVVCAP